ncbi:putative bifunctional diguanylate cyclase/phosphodiesterase [Sphingomonas qomolangmaensis]|uniref:EAL domain-containing protein n=1 Tax=Sphingomonas qomolangmaensis TaxID=2918765 RepID=A0ABY5L5P7_9SPHN|nr:GGDEF domain-containing protein [Sphingomonas qomolangmaensis]UUL81486.1 EAL domain-containing protein [Sphingomonas qomolangmaensis]
MIATGEPLDETAARLCIEAEKASPGTLCSVITVDSAGVMHPLAAPSLPSDFAALAEGVAIGPDVGSCGAAAFLGHEVTVTDIANDSRWARYKQFAEPLGVLACWSSPILERGGNPVGTFAFYFREHRGPTKIERELVRNCTHLCLIALDRERRVAEHRRRAFTDELTGLANRAAFEGALSKLDCAVPGDWAMLMIDLDNLKIVNDTFGHDVGDCLLRAAGDRIAAAVAPERVFRIGGDEFAIILQTKSALSDLDRTAERILTSIAEPASCGPQVIVPRATIGGAVLSAGDRVPGRVRQHADFAMYHAKETGRGGFVRYWPGLGSAMTRRLGDIRDVDAALRDDRIDAFYQPLFRLDTHEIVGVEALCRMRMGDRTVAAAAFHEATKDAHVATALTARMMDIVARDVRRWLDMGIPFQHVGINISSADMREGALDKVLAHTFERQGVPLDHVILEVTEAVYMGDDDQLVQGAIERLRAKGMKVALDDFGTGYASLTHLLTVPVDILKIDKSFVDRLSPDDSSIAIVEGLVQIAGKLDIRVVAEGIETEAQAAQLTAIGCNLGQGYLFSRAVDRDAATALLMNQSQAPTAIDMAHPGATISQIGRRR